MAETAHEVRYRTRTTDLPLAGTPLNPAQIWILSKDDGGPVLEVHRIEDPPSITACLPRTWLELIAEPRDVPEPPGELYLIERPDAKIAPRMVIQRALGGWVFAGGNSGGGPYTWQKLCTRFKFGQDGGATITELVPGKLYMMLEAELAPILQPATHA